MDGDVELVRLGRSEFGRVGEIDRTEQIDGLYVQDGVHLIERRGDWDSPSWDEVGDGPHSVAAKVRELHEYVDLGGVAFAAQADRRLIGVGVVIPHRRPGIAQLAFLHVTASWRGHGIGARLADLLDDVARTAGAREMVVSATPSRNTVDFYRRCGFRPTAEPLTELVELEPEDIHMHKML